MNLNYFVRKVVFLLLKNGCKYSCLDRPFFKFFSLKRLVSAQVPVN